MTQNNIKKESDKTSFNKPKEKKKWWQYREMWREESGKTALVGLLGYIICYLFLGTSWITGMFSFVFLVCGIVWLVKTIQIKIKKTKG